MTKINVIQPGTIEAPPGEIPFLLLPDRNAFQARAARLSALADGHALADYLRFLAALARAQHESMSLFRHVLLPETQELERCREHGLPPLGTRGWDRDPVWREVLRCILAELEGGALPEATRATVARLKDTDDASFERLAETLLAGDNHEKLDRAAIPFIGAALQAYWLHLVTTLGAGAFGRLEVPHLCPACGSAPMVSVVSIGADHGLRYLTCSLCNTQWHAVRIKCVFCDTTKGIAYYGIDGGSDAVKAESCDACHGYLKILYLEKDPNMDALADDVASVALDVLMAESGLSRRGTNFFLF
ncbi:MAG TPA: formate dehydrogenase accessory protein FdhE [Nitrospirales bacterium]|nr:formate dehydrogenase accessory protein FdhE [Nitrospirales bacterium]